MCGRFAQDIPPLALEALLELSGPPALERFNVAPTQNVVVCRAAEAGPELTEMKWGLIPSWAKDPAIGSKMINARAETVREKPSYRSAFKSRRCLVPVSGFFEWEQQSKPKQPYYFHMADHKPFCLAGLWETWQTPTGEPLESFTIVTTEANKLLAQYHHRMPVVISKDYYPRWLHPTVKDLDQLEELLKPYPAEEMATHPVSLLVNSPKNESRQCLLPLGQ